MKQFKVRIEDLPIEGFHSMDIWMEADNIVQASEKVMATFAPLDVKAENVVMLIEQPNRR